MAAKKLKKNCRHNILGRKAPRDLFKCDLKSPLNLEHNTFRKENNFPPKHASF